MHCNRFRFILLTNRLQTDTADYDTAESQHSIIIAVTINKKIQQSKICLLFHKRKYLFHFLVSYFLARRHVYRQTYYKLIYDCEMMFRYFIWQFHRTRNEAVTSRVCPSLVLYCRRQLLVMQNQ